MRVEKGRARRRALPAESAWFSVLFCCWWHWVLAFWLGAIRCGWSTGRSTPRLRLHGVHSEFVTVNGYKMHYLVGGSGRPLVLVHGLGSRAADWANLIPRLIDGGHRVYALDLLGYGRSAQPKDADYSISEQAAMVEGFLDSQHLQQVDLAGWSMGGWIAMQVALQQPERVRRLVLLDSAGLRFKLGFDPALFQPASPNDLAPVGGVAGAPSAPVAGISGHGDAAPGR